MAGGHVTGRTDVVYSNRYEASECVSRGTNTVLGNPNHGSTVQPVHSRPMMVHIATREASAQHGA
jgi:hypothetical protein